MSLVYTLKLLSDLLFYLSFAGLASAIAGYGPMFGSLPFFVLTAILLGALANKGRFKFLALTALIPPLISALFYGRWPLIFLAPAICYSTYYAAKLPYDIKIVRYPGVFKIYMAMSFTAAFVFFAWFHTARWALNSVMIPYVIMFSASAVVLMHMVRHDRESLLNTRFRAMIILSVIGVFLAGALLSSGRVIGFVSGILSGVNPRILIPALLIILLIPVLLIALRKFKSLWKIAAAAIAGFLLFFSLIMGLTQGDEEFQMVMDGFGAAEPGLNIFLIILLAFISMILLMMAVFLLILLYELVRMLYGFLTGKQPAGESMPEFERIALNEELSPVKAAEPKTTNQIRRIYRKFLKMCIAKQITMEPSSTTADISRQFGAVTSDYENTAALRELYINSRYGEKPSTREDIKKCKEVYNRLKKIK